MSELRQWFGYVSDLVTGTLRVWWRLLPALLAAYILGWAASTGSMMLAAWFLDRRPWLSLVIVSVGLVALLSGIIVCLRLLGRELHVRDHLPDDVEPDDRDQSLSRLVAITLLPFMGIYAVFGKVQDMGSRMSMYQVDLRGMDFDSPLIKAFYPGSTRRIVLFVAVLVSVYVARRATDLLHEHTGFRPLGLLTALLEGFFMMVTVVTGTLLLQQWAIWFSMRVASGWVRGFQDGWHTTASQIASWLPHVVSAIWQWLQHTAWPLFSSAMFQPVVWLAVAALIYGSHVLSLAEMWRKGEPLGARLDSNREIVLRRRRRRKDESGRGRRIALEIGEAFLGDVDDKYLPTVQSLRLILRVGLLFMGAYLLVYAAVTALGTVIERLAYRLAGWHPPEFWGAWLTLFELVTTPLVETLRLALLAVAFTKCLGIFATHADPSALPQSMRDDEAVPVPRQEQPA